MERGGGSIKLSRRQCRQTDTRGQWYNPKKSENLGQINK